MDTSALGPLCLGWLWEITAVPEIVRPANAAADSIAASGKQFGAIFPRGSAPLVAEPFDAFTFSPATLSVYQLGNFGTARKKLKAWELKP